MSTRVTFYRPILFGMSDLKDWQEFFSKMIGINSISVLNDPYISKIFEHIFKENIAATQNLVVNVRCAKAKVVPHSRWTLYKN